MIALAGRPGPGSSTTILGLYRRVWDFAQGARVQYAAAMFLLAASMVVKLLIPWLAAQAINTVQVQGATQLPLAAWYVGMIFLVYVGSWAMHGPGRVLERNVGLQVRRQVADALYAKLASLPLSWHEGRHSGDTEQRAQQASQALFDFTQNQFLYVQSFVNIAGPLVALWIVSAWVGGAALAGFVVIAFIILRFDRALMRLAAQENDAQRRYAAMLLDFLGNIGTVLSLRLQSASRKLLDGRLQHVFAPLRRSIILNEGKWCAVDLLSVGLTWVLVAVYAWQTQRESTAAGVPVLLGGLFMVYQYAQQAGGVIGSMAANFQGFARMRTDFASADPIFAATPAPAPVHEVPPLWKTIEVSGVTHTYVRGNGELGGVLDASVTLRRGERIALVGPSGAGKSTLLRLLAGLYTPAHGFYQIDGEIGFGVKSLATISTLVPQEAEVFEASLRDNLAFGMTVPQEALDRAMYVSNLDVVVASLPAGLETPISERGFNLSGGQRQRLALARGFLAADPMLGRPGSLLLLDEPTSALDPMTEARVFKRLRETMPDACVVASIHRMSALSQFDSIILMQDGRVLDQGTLAELMARQPIMREMAQEASKMQGAA